MKRRTVSTTDVKTLIAFAKNYCRVYNDPRTWGDVCDELRKEKMKKRIITQKEFKKYILSELDIALKSARSFSDKDIVKIEYLRGQIKYQVERFYWEPSYKSEDEKEACRREVKGRIAEMKTQINDIYKRYGWITIQFPNGRGQYRLVNARQEIERVRDKVRKIPERNIPLKKHIIKNENPRAARQEELGKLVPVEKEGWFSDGYILVKGDPPKNAKYADDTNGSPSRKLKEDYVDGLLAEISCPAQKRYYVIFSRFWEMVSKNPIAPVIENNHKYVPSVIFQQGGNFFEYNQDKLNIIENRYDVYYEIGEQGSLSAFTKNGEKVAMLMPIRPSNTEYGEIATQKPMMMNEALRLGLIKKKVEVKSKPGTKSYYQDRVLNLGL